MYKISELAALVGLSRTALLYYENQQLISGQRLDNGYRIYSDKDVQRIRLIQQLLAAGLTIKECKACLEGKIDKSILLNRLQTLDAEILHKQQSRTLLAAMLGEGDAKAWHQDLDRVAPHAHLEWLMTQGFNEKEALRLRWLSKNMNQHEHYMADFMAVFSTLERWGPGSEDDTSRALAASGLIPNTILEVGCGKGLATQVLAKQSQAQIIAVDNEQSALDSLVQKASQLGWSDRLQTLCASMTDLHLADTVDLIWAEGSAYIMGVENALSQWKSSLADNGVLMFSDMVWRTDAPSQASVEFWQQEYPDIQSVATRIAQIEQAGYRVVDHFAQSEQAWLNYYAPLAERVAELESSMADSAALKDIKHEVNICNEYANEFGYHMFLVAKQSF